MPANAKEQLITSTGPYFGHPVKIVSLSQQVKSNLFIAGATSDGVYMAEWQPWGLWLLEEPHVRVHGKESKTTLG